MNQITLIVNIKGNMTSSLIMLDDLIYAVLINQYLEFKDIFQYSDLAIHITILLNRRSHYKLGNCIHSSSLL